MVRTYEQLVEAVAPWLQPISPAHPAGESAKFDDAYEALRVEIMKLESPRGEIVAWPLVHSSGVEILSTRSKDLLIASHLAVALYRERGFEGLALGTVAMVEIMQHFWPDLFPPLARLRARVGALEWYLDKAGLIFAEVKSPAEKDRDGLVELKLGVERLRTVVAERFVEQAPAMRPLQDAVDKLVLSLPAQPKPVPIAPAITSGTSTTGGDASAASAQAEAASAGSSSAADRIGAAAAFAFQGSPSAATPGVAVSLPAEPVAAPGGAMLANREELSRFLQACGKSLVDAGTAMRQSNPSDAVAYRLLRAGMWLATLEPPPVGGNGRTMIPALPADLRAKLDRLAEMGNWQPLLQDAEDALLRNRLNFDLMRYSATAMAALGDTYSGVRRVCMAELRGLLDRLPALPKLRTTDGSPLADERTKTWLGDEVVAAAKGGGSAANGAAASASVPEAAMADIQKLLTANHMAQAMAAFEPFVSTAGDGRGRAQLRVLQAELCRKAGATKVAEAIYEALDAELTMMHMERWEPDLMVKILAGRLSCLRSHKKPGEVPKAGEAHNEEQALYRRLAQLRPSLALELGA